MPHTKKPRDEDTKTQSSKVTKKTKTKSTKKLRRKEPKKLSFPKTSFTLGKESSKEDRIHYAWLSVLVALAAHRGDELEIECLTSLGAMIDAFVSVAPELPALEFSTVSMSSDGELGVRWSIEEMGALISFEYSDTTEDPGVGYCMVIGSRIIPGKYDWDPFTAEIPEDLLAHLKDIEEACNADN